MEAGLVSPIALIAVSIAGVCGFVLPNRDLASAVRVWWFAIGIAGAIAGLSGIIIVSGLLVIHLLMLRSMGVSYVRFFEPGLLRSRMKKRKNRPEHLDPVDRRSQK